MQDQMLPSRSKKNSLHSSKHQDKQLEKNAQVRCFRRAHSHPPEMWSCELKDGWATHVVCFFLRKTSQKSDSAGCNTWGNFDSPWYVCATSVGASCVRVIHLWQMDSNMTTRWTCHWDLERGNLPVCDRIQSTWSIGELWWSGKKSGKGGVLSDRKKIKNNQTAKKTETKKNYRNYQETYFKIVS